MYPTYPTVSGPPPAPSPPAPPTPPPAPTPAGSSHYEKPPCQSDEVALKIEGKGGGIVCSPKCDASGSCPTDVPEGTKATPNCYNSGGEQCCALQCGFGSGCPAGATCNDGPFNGLCVYTQTAETIQGKVVTMTSPIDVTV